MLSKTLKNGFSIPVFGLGTWGMGGDRGASNEHDERDTKAIRAALDMGYTLIDTAELYGNRHCEELIGEVLSDYDRKEIFLISKIFPTITHKNEVRERLIGSLERLRVDYLDLYLLHSPRFEPALEDVIEELCILVDKGFIKHIGVSNFNVEQMERVRKASRHPIVLNQVHYNLHMREMEARGVLDYCQKNDIILQAWRPVQKAMFEEAEIPAVLAEMMKKYQKTAHQIMINWLVSQQSVTTIAKSVHEDRLLENLDAARDWNLSDEDIERLRAEYPDPLLVSDAVPLD